MSCLPAGINGVHSIRFFVSTDTRQKPNPGNTDRQVEDNMRKMLNLRYRLLPYIYSEAWQVTKNGSTMMRPLVMDFREDADAVGQPYEYMFGKAFLISPIVEAGVDQWRVYLPKSASWYDLWTGKHYIGGQNVETEAPLDKIPVFVKGGSIIPIGPVVQYAGEKKQDNLEIRVYEGSDGVFTLYEDEGNNYNYEKGIYSAITFSWDDAKKTLAISNRKGSFPGMSANRKFNILCVSTNKTAGMDADAKYDKEVIYTGSKMIVKF